MTPAAPPPPDPADPALPNGWRGWRIFISLVIVLLLVNVSMLLNISFPGRQLVFLLAMVCAPPALALGLGARAGMASPEARSAADRGLFLGTLLVTLASAVPWAIVVHVELEDGVLSEQAGSVFAWSFLAYMGLVSLAGIGHGLGRWLRRRQDTSQPTAVVRRRPQEATRASRDSAPGRPPGK